ncbi:MAG: hypothetical protein JXR96_25050 [Deltaproteobacteria bacterium]|nr:hypothetical protein [Deltaproteobacteria bacterium]
MRTQTIALVLLAGLMAACGAGGDTSLNVTWTFDSGDCAANNVETVRVSWGPQGGEMQTAEFVCSDGQGLLGDLSAGSYSITAQGLDAGGVVRAISYGNTLTVGDGGTGGMPVELHLHPSPGDVTVTWTMAGGGHCPGTVILPFHITIYHPPAQPGGPLTDDVATVQESCSTGQVVLTDIPPGDYVVELDSRATTPDVYGTEEVTVVAGEDVQVDLRF